MPTSTDLLQYLSLNRILWKLKIFWWQLLAAGGGIAGDCTQPLCFFCFWLLLSQNTPTMKKIAPTILNYISVWNKIIIWGAGMEMYWKQNYFHGLGMSSWNSNKLKWTFLKMINGLNLSAGNCRPEVLVWKKKKSQATEGRVGHSIEWAGLFLTGTCAVNLLC